MLRSRPETPAWRWRRVSGRCRELLPAELAWAAPLLETAPRPVLCGEQQAEALERWIDSLPATAQVSIAWRGAAASPSQSRHSGP